MRDPRRPELFGEARPERPEESADDGTGEAGGESAPRRFYRLRRDAGVVDPAGTWIEPAKVYEGAALPDGPGGPWVRLFHPSEPGQYYDIRRGHLALTAGAPDRRRPAEERRFLDWKGVTWVMTAERTPGAAEDAAAPEGVLVFSSPVETRRLVRTAGHRNWRAAPAHDLRAWCRAAVRS
jgi:hypothetical protein